jgi:hypothetical protein
MPERGNVDFNADDGLYVGLFGCAIEIDYAVHCAVVGDSKTIHSQLFCPAHQMLDSAHAIEQAIFGMNVEVSKHEPLELSNYSPYYSTAFLEGERSVGSM